MFAQRKGQGLSVNAIILIILGVIVLVVLILGFTLGWGRILPFVSKSNADSIVTACSISCTTSSQFEFCSVKRELKTAEVKLKDVTCFYLSEKQKQYGVGPCGSIQCGVEILEAELLGSIDSQTNLPAECSDPKYIGKTLQIFERSTNTLKHYNCLPPA